MKQDKSLKNIIRLLLGVLIITFLEACSAKTENNTKSVTEDAHLNESENLSITELPDSVIETKNIHNFKVVIYTPSNENPTVSEQGIIVYDTNGNQVSSAKYVKSAGHEWRGLSSNYKFSKDNIEISFESDAFHPGAEASDDPSIGVSMDEFLLLDDPYLILDKTIFKKWTEQYQITKSGVIQKADIQQKHEKVEVSEFYRFDVLPPERLRILRNSIFANYGYKFNSEELLDYFKKKSWYKPERENVDSFLTETDKEIIAYLKELEQKSR